MYMVYVVWFMFYVLCFKTVLVSNKNYKCDIDKLSTIQITFHTIIMKDHTSSATCDKLPAGRMIPYVIPGVTEPFSLEPGIQISLSCYDGFQLDQGSPSATCFSGMYFEYSGTNGDLPKCIPTATSGKSECEIGFLFSRYKLVKR